MSLIRLIIFILFFTFFASALLAAPYIDTTRILEISSSGKTIYLSYGSLENIKHGEWAILFGRKVLKNRDDREVYIPVAKVKAVKVSKHNSIWVIFKTYNREFLKRSSKVGIITERAMNSGRKDLLIDSTKLIANKSDYTKKVDEYIKDDGLEMVLEDADYKVIETTHAGDVYRNYDIQKLDIDTWEGSERDEQLVNASYYRSPHPHLYEQKKRLQNLERTAYAIISKANEDKLKHQKEDTTLDWNKSIYEEKLEDDIRIEKKQEHLAQTLLSKGDRWSEDYSDDELKELLHTIGGLREKDRRKWLYAGSFTHQLYFDVATNMLDNSNINDSDNRQRIRYHVAANWEFYPFKDIYNLQRISFIAGIRRSQDILSTGNKNATIQDVSGNIQVNWYPFKFANHLDSNIVFFGLSFRSGYAGLQVESENERGNYQLYGVPGILAGVKYNFYNGMSLRAMASYENILLDRLSVSSGASNLDDRLSYIEGKMAVSIGYNL